tara:strand:+ start:141 stop:1112 length:972 start_codon:yes stop_codon:yes gene_type:complete
MITTTFEAAFAILAVEFALLAPLAVFFSLRGRRNVEAATTSEATELVTKVADTEDARRTALQTVFREKYRYEDSELEQAVEEFMQREKAFYNAVVGAVLGRGDSKISDINDELTKVVAPWISLTPKNMVAAESVEAVATEKDRIEIELGNTKETLEKMIAEYNRAFLREAEKDKAEAEAEANPSVDDEPEPDVADELEELDYKTEELHDLDDVLAAIEAKKSDPGTAAAGAAAVAEPPSGSIVNLDDDDDEAVDPEAEFAGELAAAVVEEADAPEELESLEELDDDVLGDLPPKRGDKQMTANDLDELMESLDADGADETESA